MSLTNRGVKQLYDRGYRVINENFYNPSGKKLSKYSNKKRKHGYYSHNFSINKKTLSISMHKMIAYQKFGNLLFKEGIVVRHLDGNHLNNKELNIAIGTQSDNMMDIPKKIRLKNAFNASYKNRRFTDKEVIKIVNDHKKGLSYNKLCIKYNTSKSTLSYLFNKAIYNKKLVTI